MKNQKDNNKGKKNTDVDDLPPVKDDKKKKIDFKQKAMYSISERLENIHLLCILPVRNICSLKTQFSTFTTLVSF